MDETNVRKLLNYTGKGRPQIDFKGRYAAKLREYRLRAGYNQPQLAAAVGISKNAVTNWESGRARPDIETLVKLCSVLSASADELLGITDCGDRPTNSEVLLLRSIRSLSRHDRLTLNATIDAMLKDQYEEFRRRYKTNFLHRTQGDLSACAGTGTYLSDTAHRESVLLRTCDESIACDEIIQISGDSMEPDYHNGDRVLVEHMPEVHEGATGIFVLNGEGMIKVYHKDGLYPRNPKYKPIYPSDNDEIRCVGLVLCTLTDDLLPTREEQIMIDEIQNEEVKRRTDH